MKFTPVRGVAPTTAIFSIGTRWPPRCRRTPRTWASPTSSCCRISEHPFDGSWGYQTLGLFAPSARFGAPEGFARFVDACHAHGSACCSTGCRRISRPTRTASRFDGTALYEHADPREGEHRDWGTLIYNFGRTEVRNFLIGSALYWLERSASTGCASMRWPRCCTATTRATKANGCPTHGGRENLEAIALLRESTRASARCARRDHRGGGIDRLPRRVRAGPMPAASGFHYKWNMGWMNDTLRYMHEDPVHRRWHHDQMSFGLVYAFSENFVLPLSHDEVVHGKGSLLGKMPGDDWQRFANLRAYYGFMWAHPGKKLLFMGQEFAQPRANGITSNFTPVPRYDVRIGVPDDGADHWREALNTDSRHYGGSDLGNGGGALRVEAMPAQGCVRSLALTLPPLATIVLLPA
jgi:alpha-1,4-glucan:alpha-1,4-glucan 6-glycosyltransferase